MIWKRTMLFPKTIAMCLLMCVLFAGCNIGALGGSAKIEPSNLDFVRTPPPVTMPVAAGEVIEERDDGERSGVIDISNAAKGYVMAKVTAPVTAKFRLEKGSYQYIYELSNDGEENFYPLAVGDGNYSLTIFLNIEGEETEYEVFLQAEVNAVLENEFTSFLVPNKIVDYNETSQVVKLSHDITKNASTDIEVVQQIYAWVSDNIVYDDPKAQTVSGGGTYVPNVDEILQLKKGICYDYAAVAAAMMRANGIPCKLIMGDVESEEQGSVYHAWNTIWLEGEGSITVKIEVISKEWQRIDLTFDSSGDPSIAKFIGDGSNYTDIYFH